MGGLGSKSAKCTVSTLNYSGIYLSPFEFYGIDNWQELENIGKIFQEQLRGEYTNLLFESYGKSSIDLPKEYTRSTFEWHLGDIDKKIHAQRYSPLYGSEESLERRVVGVGIQHVQNSPSEYLLSQEQFFKQWDQQFAYIYHLVYPSQNNEAEQALQKLHKTQCKFFDFLCYKSMILYLNENLNMQDRIYIDYRANLYVHSFEEIVSSTKAKKESEIIQAYKKLLIRYSKRIPKNKLELTITHLFKSNSPEIIILTEASQQLIKQLQKNEEYLCYNSSRDKYTKKTVLLIKKSLPFFKLHSVKVQTQKINPQILQDTEYNLAKMSFTDQFESYKKLIPKLRQFITANLSKINKEQPTDSSHAHKLSQRASKFLDRLQKQGVLTWINEKGNLYHFYGKNQVFIGGFHFSSQAELNRLQIQVLGLILYHLICVRKTKFIFAGDFNCFISLVQRDNHLSLFSFVKHTFKQNSKQINQMIRAINIFPQHSKNITAKKKRTILQAQFKKVNQLNQECRDQIFTNYPLQSKLCHVCEIGDIGSKKTDNQNFLPRIHHPYDHFLVEAVLDLSQQLQ